MSSVSSSSSTSAIAQAAAQLVGATLVAVGETPSLTPTNTHRHLHKCPLLLCKLAGDDGATSMVVIHNQWQAEPEVRGTNQPSQVWSGLDELAHLAPCTIASVAIRSDRKLGGLMRTRDQCDLVFTVDDREIVVAPYAWGCHAPIETIAIFRASK